ncbi:MAG: aminoacyl-tRNA hydrolase [Alphaproteobacteria bacterium]|nr:aminoacyl-tRNA hydrolase [Alphaproteobacteria bacterium]
MMLLVGLGNPGASYARHRHNVGFMAIDEIASTCGFSPFRAKFEGNLAEGIVEGEKVLALKPQTFMNDSGRSVAAAARFYRLKPSDIVVFHDELDLAPGKLRIKTGGGVAGHNGLRSISAHLGPDFRRVRIGIGHPGDKSRVSSYVLGDFAKADAEWLEATLAALAAEAPRLLVSDEAYAAAIGQRLAPRKPAKVSPSAAPSDAESKPKSHAENNRESEGATSAIGAALRKLLKP